MYVLLKQNIYHYLSYIKKIEVSNMADLTSLAELARRESDRRQHIQYLAKLLTYLHIGIQKYIVRPKGRIICLP